MQRMPYCLSRSETRDVARSIQICELVHSGREVVIVTSGAVGFGKMRLQVSHHLSVANANSAMHDIKCLDSTLSSAAVVQSTECAP